MSNEIARMADVAMYEAEPDADEPRVYLMNMTSNPLRTIAAAAEMYRGHVVRAPHQISRTRAEEWLDDLLKTGTKAPLEFVTLDFLFEGVTRAFTHQLVRQRTATYVQESMRFAVKREAKVAMPPSIARLKEDDPARVTWQIAVNHVINSYNDLIDRHGIPAEDARGLLPTNITTKIHYTTNLRNLMDHSGARLCSQAQYEWKQVWMLMLQAITNYPHAHGCTADAWQYEAIAKLFKPICFQTGKCEFMGELADRFCSIRDRVEAHHAKGEPSTTWIDIDPREAMIEGAARTRLHKEQ